jgi:hypothetical protein
MKTMKTTTTTKTVTEEIVAGAATLEEHRD